MLEELKPVGESQLAVVENDVALLYELDPAEQTAWTWKSYDVPAVSSAKSVEVVATSLIVVHVDDDEAFHLRL